MLSLIERYLESPEAIVVTGFRRVGKSTLIRHVFDGLKTDNKLFLDLESPVNQQIFQNSNYDAIVSELKKLGLNTKKPMAYVFIDEIQFVKEIPSVIKYLFDHYKIKFVVTGSSSFYLKNLFTESLAGRKFLFELMPLDFEEFLWFKGEKLALNSKSEFLKHFYEEYMSFGGLPAVVLEDSKEGKIQRLDDALGSYFQLDVANLASFRDIKNLKSLLFLLAARVGNKVDITKLSESLGVSRQTLYGYIEFFEQTYLIHLVPAYSASEDVTVRKVPKLYFIDSGLLGRVSKISEGQLFENTIFNQLFIGSYFNNPSDFLKSRVSYFQKKSGAEIDFILGNKGYEVKLSGTKSDVARLRRFAGGLKLSESHVVSLTKLKTTMEGIINPYQI